MAASRHVDFLGQGHSWDLYCNCGNARFLTHCTRRELNLCPGGWSIVPQQKLLFFTLFDFTPLILFFYGLLLRATPEANGGSQATAAYSTATATQDLRGVCDLHHSSRQCRIPSTLSKVRDRTCILMDSSWICFHCATKGTRITRLILEFKSRIPVISTVSRFLLLFLFLQHKLNYIFPIFFVMEKYTKKEI